MNNNEKKIVLPYNVTEKFVEEIFKNKILNYV